MKIFNVHERHIKAELEQVGALLDGLAGPDDRLWPTDLWMPVKMEPGLSVGAKGGHGPVRYHVEEYSPGEKLIFRFDPAGVFAGADGRHYWEIVPNEESVTLRHVIDADGDLFTWLKWVFMVRSVHDALLEDSLDCAERNLAGGPAVPAKWSLWVRFVRYILIPGPQRQ